MSRNILLFSRDPGGANVIIPVARALRQKGYHVLLYGKDLALDRYRAEGLIGVDILTAVKEIESDNIKNFLWETGADLVITGTSANDFTEKYLWQAARELCIPSLAVLDQWLNYGIRFSRYGLRELNQYLQEREHPYLPTLILVMDHTACSDIVNEGVDSSLVRVVGHPYLETLSHKKDIDSAVVAEFRQYLGAGKDEFLITFAPEPISLVYNENDDSQHYWGYTERTILKELLIALSQLMNRNDKTVRLVIRPHPQERPDNFDDIVEPYRGLIPIQFDSSLGSLETILASDLVVGMSSMFLLEAAAMGKTIASVLIGLCRENPFILARSGALASILDRDSLFSFLYKTMVLGDISRVKLDIAEGATDKIVNLVEGYICQD